MRLLQGVLLRTGVGASEFPSRRTVNVDENPTGCQGELLDIDAYLNEWRDHRVVVLLFEDSIVIVRGGKT